jgi:thiamine biosynthesis lipoprotein
MHPGAPVHGLHRLEHIMGMPIIVEVRDPEVDPAGLDRVFEWFRFVDATFSTYKHDSEISRLNRGALSLAGVHPDVRAVLDRCEELRGETQGYFDMRAPFRFGIRPLSTIPRLPAVDPSGYVKGWSVDRAARILDLVGARSYCIYAGGDIRVRGNPAPESPWRIGIQHPVSKDQVAAVVRGTDFSIATSGTYERGAHIVDPLSGRIPAGVLSVTIVGSDLGTADAYATAAFAMGEAGPAWTARLEGYEAMTILADYTVLSTPGFPAE